MPSGSLSSTKPTQRLQKLHTPSKRMTERPPGSEKSSGSGPLKGPVTALARGGLARGAVTTLWAAARATVPPGTRAVAARRARAGSIRRSPSVVT
eukprot:7331585-Prymnesium_polylepis.2